jgi:two-component sensor histidine kinase
VGLLGVAARTGSTTVVNDVTRDDRFYFPPGEQAVTGSEMSVPIKIGRRVLGVLDIQTSDVNAFDASDRAAMETLANQVAVALENARLYAETKDEAEIKATLLRELSHRVKNNLTAVVGLLSLGLDDETISREDILNETLMRVQSMAVAHTLLANSPWARVDVMELSRRVIGDTIRQMTLPGRHIVFDVRGDSLEISAQQATSLALVLNELVANAIKHGGAGTSPGLSLCIQHNQNELRLEFSNQIAEGDDSSPDWISSGVGLRLIRTLVEKDLGGRLTFASHDKTFFSVIWFTPQT